MAEEKNKIAFCPNCNQPAIRSGNEITCEICDATYRITKTDGAKVKKIGPIKDLTDRVSALEQLLGPSNNVDEPEPTEQPGPDDPPEPDDSEEEFLPR